MAPDSEISLSDCKEAFGLDTELTPERAAEIATILDKVLASKAKGLPLDLLRKRDYSLAEFFINQPFDEQAFSAELRTFIREDPRVEALGRAIANTVNRNINRPTGKSSVPPPLRVPDTQALRQKHWLTQQLVVFELIRDCPQEQVGEDQDGIDEEYENAG